MMSSTKRARRVSITPTFILSISGQVTTYWDNGSIDRLNSKGDRGQPCRVPFCNIKGVERNPGVYTRALGLVYKADINVLKGPKKPILSRTACIHVHLTLSNAFPVSIVRIAGDGCLIGLNFISSRTVSTFLIFATRAHPWINLTWLGEMMSGRNRASLSVIILEISLTSMLIRDIGRYDAAKVKSFPCFGSTLMWAVFMHSAISTPVR